MNKRTGAGNVRSESGHCLPRSFHAKRSAGSGSDHLAVLVPIVDRRHAVVLLEELAEIVNIIIAHTVGDDLDALMLIGLELDTGALQTHLDQLIDRRLAGFLLEDLGNVGRAQIHILGDQIQRNLIGVVIAQILTDLTDHVCLVVGFEGNR